MNSINYNARVCLSISPDVQGSNPIIVEPYSVKIISLIENYDKIEGIQLQNLDQLKKAVGGMQFALINRGLWKLTLKELTANKVGIFSKANPNQYYKINDGECIIIGNHRLFIYTFGIAQGIHISPMDPSMGVLVTKPIPEEGQAMIIGRDGDDKTIIKDDVISKAHCKIKKVKGKLEIKDMDSTNGTWIQMPRYEGTIELEFEYIEKLWGAKRKDMPYFTITQKSILQLLLPNGLYATISF